MARHPNLGTVQVRVTILHGGNAIDRTRIRLAVRWVLAGEAPGRKASIHVVVVDDETIRRLHHRFLGDDTPTDVLTFPLTEPASGLIEGEIVVSWDTALASAPGYGWSAMDETILYTIHGTLHLVGFDDVAPDDRRRMRRREAKYLKALGMPVRNRSRLPPRNGG